MAAIFHVANGRSRLTSRDRGVIPASVLPTREVDAMNLSPQDDEIDIDARRRRAKFRAWHRGMKEMDLLLGKYADAHVSAMSGDDIAAFEALLEILDRDLFKWFTGEGPVPVDQDTPLFRAICRFHGIAHA